MAWDLTHCSAALKQDTVHSELMKEVLTEVATGRMTMLGVERQHGKKERRGNIAE